ncbi:MAG: hypothetical protein JWQ90_3567 [Hydrocarboniphaga sp.]|uniref:HNH endonuclease n=1 Tax=Hydrocarboniphaga sp. TaxID=2033016 RepID=UPI00260DAEE3|nr:HNH endonuclease signature motif containing protein [Hydrocarboniphaga sp.]MDB5971117.1 hypothetical protein [Hydrocarboniphaga sp.]
MEPNDKTVKRLFALSGNRCAFPSCQLPIFEDSGVVTGEMCHIKARSPGGPRFDPAQTEAERHGFDNLILLCRRHHKVVDAQPDVYTVEALRQIKSIHENVLGRPEREQDGFFASLLINDYRKIVVKNNSGNVAINSPGAIQGHTVNVKTSKKKVVLNSPPGSIGADLQASRYVQYLINRYNKFGADDPTRKTSFSYGAISKNIETTFGSQWKLLPIERAGAVFDYLQNRIARTRQARINQGKAHRSFRSYEEFLAGDEQED